MTMAMFSSPLSVSKRGRDDADGQQSAKRSKTFSSPLSSSPSARANFAGLSMGADSRMQNSMQEDDAMGQEEFEFDSDEDGCCYVPPPQDREDDFVKEHPLQWRADPPNTPQPMAQEYDSYIPDQFAASAIASTSASAAAAYPAQQSLFQMASSTPAYPSHSNPHPAFPSSYPSHSNPASFTDMHGITRVFSSPNGGGEMHLDDATEGAGYASYGYSHQPTGQYEQIMA